MYLLEILILIYGGIAASSYKTVIWKNWEDFEAGGWQVFAGAPVASHYKPSSFLERYKPLDELSDGVWTGREGSYWFGLDVTGPEFCGMTEATLTVKMYCDGSNTECYAWPCVEDSGSSYCTFSGQADTFTWITQNASIDPTTGTIRLSAGRNPHLGKAIIDEVWLTHNGGNCDSDKCNQTCEYVAIDCHNYYSCIDFDHKEYFNCALEDGVAFNPTLGVCDRIENVEGCKPPPKCVCEYRPNPENCSYYYFCPDTCQEELCETRRCPGDLLWSVDLKGDGSGHQQCAIPEKTKCI